MDLYEQRKENLDNNSKLLRQKKLYINVVFKSTFYFSICFVYTDLTQHNNIVIQIITLPSISPSNIYQESKSQVDTIA